ncbi:MAG TPA: Arc family DNA-binding protein [Planctomycetes bacterium]|nr:Arc family DNA-binding protein [Planctomycetota bacterium]
MAQRKSFLLRVPKELLDELRSWAAQDMRSLNGQIEFLLRDALRRRKKSERMEDESQEQGVGKKP